MDVECYDFVSDCRVRAATDLIAHTWDPVVLTALRAGPARRAALIPAIGGLSDKTLSQSLARLSAAGLVARTAASTSRNVGYALTALGRSFVDGPLAALGRWAVEREG